MYKTSYERAHFYKAAMILMKCCTFKLYFGPAHEGLIFYLISASCSLNIHGHIPGVARGLMLACAFIFTHSLCVCVGGAVKALMRLSACVATSKRWHLICYTIRINNLIRWLIFFTKWPYYY